MSKKVRPPAFYRVPILPTLAAVGLSLLACSKSTQSPPEVVDLGGPIAEKDPDARDLGLVLPNLTETSGPVEDLPVDSPGEQPLPTAKPKGEVPFEPIPDAPIVGDYAAGAFEEAPDVSVQGQMYMGPVEPVPDTPQERPSKVQPEKPPTVRLAGKPAVPKNKN